MNRLMRISFLLLAVAGCGARTSMEACAEGSEECACHANGACNPGLVCTGEVCVRPAPAGSGGSPGTGGALAAVGGSTGMMAGGMMAGGGMVGSGGGPSGGVVGSGGRPGSGGVVGSGGRPGTGGVGSGGTAASGGSKGSGGTTAGATLVAGRADGAMNGWGWVAFAPKDSVTSPTCGGRQLVSPGGCDVGYDWLRSGGLCVSGTIPLVTDGDYASNWGILFAANCRDPAGGTLGGSYQNVSFNMSGTVNGLRAVVHRAGDADSVNYCANMTPGQAIAFPAFNTSCWDNLGIPLTLADVPNLDWIGVQVPASPVSAFNLSNLCLNAIMFR